MTARRSPGTLWSIRTCTSSGMEEEKPDPPANKAVCWLTWTTEETKRIIQENLHRAPMYSGLIEGVGPRYCPSGRR